jgi:hypothetical protein
MGQSTEEKSIKLEVEFAPTKQSGASEGVMSDSCLREMYATSSGYDVRQVCRNGHQVTDAAMSEPEHRQDYCSKCGAATIMECEKCKTPIRGFYRGSGVVSISNTEVPKYCIGCGEPYPWQTEALENLEGIIQESGLSAEEVAEAKSTLPDVVRETPKAELATLRLRRFLSKVEKPINDVAIAVIGDIASETAKKTLGLK